MTEKCDHFKLERKTETDYSYYDEDTDQYGTMTVEVEVSACIDIDLHRYRCTLCGEVGYYSGRARKFFESGIDENNFIRDSYKR